MNTTCPHCSSPLSFSAGQQEKIREAQANLKPGAALKVKCPKCGGIVELGGPAPAQGKAAQAAPAPAAPKPAQKAPAKKPPRKRNAPKPAPGGVQPPLPPSLDWLAEGGGVGESGKVEDVPMALVVYPEGAERENILDMLRNLGYQTVAEVDAEQARERMRFARFACIVYKADMHGGPAESPFHALMCAMNMDRRRHIFYILIGDELNTLYDLEALSCSANLVVNTEELPTLPVILRKAFQNHEELFGAFIEELGKHAGR